MSTCLTVSCSLILTLRFSSIIPCTHSFRCRKTSSFGWKHFFFSLSLIFRRRRNDDETGYFAVDPYRILICVRCMQNASVWRAVRQQTSADKVRRDVKWDGNKSHKKNDRLEHINQLIWHNFGECDVQFDFQSTKFEPSDRDQVNREYCRALWDCTENESFSVLSLTNRWKRPQSAKWNWSEMKQATDSTSRSTNNSQRTHLNRNRSTWTRQLFKLHENRFFFFFHEIKKNVFFSLIFCRTEFKMRHKWNETMWARERKNKM